MGSLGRCLSGCLDGRRAYRRVPGCAAGKGADEDYPEEFIAMEEANTLLLAQILVHAAKRCTCYSLHLTTIQSVEPGGRDFDAGPYFVSQSVGRSVGQSVSQSVSQ